MIVRDTFHSKPLLILWNLFSRGENWWTQEKNARENIFHTKNWSFDYHIIYHDFPMQCVLWVSSKRNSSWSKNTLKVSDSHCKINDNILIKDKFNILLCLTISQIYLYFFPNLPLDLSKVMWRLYAITHSIRLRFGPSS